MYMCMQVYDSGQHQCKQDQHYSQAVSPSCKHPNGDGWPALSTGRRDKERTPPTASLAHKIYGLLELIVLSNNNESNQLKSSNERIWQNRLALFIKMAIFLAHIPPYVTLTYSR